MIYSNRWVSTQFEQWLADHGVALIRPAKRGEQPRRGARQLKPIRQIIESINATLKTI